MPWRVERRVLARAASPRYAALRSSGWRRNAHAPYAPITAAIHAMMDRLKKRLRFISPVSFEIQMPHDDWHATFAELNTTLQSLGHCDTNKSTR